MSRIRSNVQSGLLTGFINIFAVLLGLTGLAGAILEDWFNLPSPVFGAWILLLAVAFWGGARTVGGARPRGWGEILAGGLVSGAIHALLMGVYVWALASLVDSGANVRKYLTQISAEAVGLLTFGSAPRVAALIVFILLVAVGVLGALVPFASARYKWRGSLVQRWSSVRSGVGATSLVQHLTRHKNTRYVLYAIGVLLLVASPFGLGRYYNYLLGTVGIYVILGLGLNVVVGMAGLLNLGYAAFFAIGAYTVAILTAPQFNINWSFWAAVPIGMLMATLTGVVLSLPVLRMRGDYLAIVTLGFGEIIRILARSEALIGLTGGPRGIRAVAGPGFFGINVSSAVYFMYLILLGILLAIFVVSRLQHSRLGRAWMAMREDEDVAQAMGIHTLKYKVQAFALSAAFAGLGGVLFASRNQFTGPEDFTLLVSVNVLCLVIIGGMGSIPGVLVGAFVLKGLPEFLRQLDDYRMLAFGALLVVMMILRPEGLWPSTRGQAELREHEELPLGTAITENPVEP
jgi:ABC-type branched-subunit amino acid transport system permease subunit